MSRRKICVVTGSRADYGLLSGLLRAIKNDPTLQLQIIATGTHLAPSFGMTAREIETDGFAIDARVDMELSEGDSAQSIARSFSLCIAGVANAFDALTPDIVVLLGDRYEILAAGIAAMMSRIPIGHIHGGEATEGQIDEAIRHALTKMAHLHFAAAEPYARRILQLGEQPDRIFVTGAPGLDQARMQRLMDRAEWEKAFGFALGSPLFLVTYHPVTLSAADQKGAAQSLIDALGRFPTARIVMTGVNSDPKFLAIRQCFEAFAKTQHDRVCYRETLGQRGYLSAMRIADAVIGNSSSGIIEAPYFRVPTVNIGERQRGRLTAASVINCGETEPAISAAITRALSPEFRASLPSDCSLYGHGDASTAIKDILKSADLSGILFKRFHDLPELGGAH